MRFPWQRPAGESESVILLYHRVAEPTNDPHLLSVSPENFEAQLRAFKKRFPPVSLRQIVDGINNQKPVRGFAVTFDDGYADNYLAALPILEKLKIPATIYVVSGMVDQTKPYYWDEETPTADQGRAVTLQELRTTDKHPLIEVGSHTVSHPHLGTLSSKEQKLELQQSKAKLEELLEHEVPGFAYPFGACDDDFTDETKKIAEECGYEYACINIRGRVDASTELYGIPRVLVRDWSPEQTFTELQDVLPR